MELVDKVAIITGSSRGIGKTIASEFARNGARIVISSSNMERATMAQREIQDLGGEAIAISCDVRDYGQCKTLCERAIKRFQRIDILVNNAGVTRDNLLLRMKEEEWDEVLSVNLKGTFNATKACVKYMLKQKEGRIINISSVVGEMGNAGQSNYSAAKAGIIGFTKAIAKEFASRNITSNAIAPGFIETSMTDSLSDELKEELKVRIPIGRFGNPKDVADLAVFLASDKASYITGEVIKVDGGLYI